jgi:biotin transport system substrate-specific component
MTAFMPHTLADGRRAPLVLSDLLAPRVRRTARSALLVAGGAGLVGLAAQLSVHVPGTPVPVTGQTLAVLLIGSALGAQLGAISLLTYLLAGGLGLPWFAHGGSGWGAPTFGYVVGFVAAAALVGWWADRGGDRSPLRALGAMVVGSLVIYAVGVPWLAQALHVSVSHAWAVGARPFLAGDALKVLLAAGLLPAAWALVRRTARPRR